MGWLWDGIAKCWVHVLVYDDVVVVIRFLDLLEGKVCGCWCCVGVL